ncbi:hypothetical protein EZS27_041933, partial [termite gut metagenome]
MNDFTKVRSRFWDNLYGSAVSTTATYLEGDKFHNFYVLLCRGIMGIAIQLDVNSDRYKIDCTMKPLTV